MPVLHGQQELGTSMNKIARAALTGAALVGLSACAGPISDNPDQWLQDPVSANAFRKVPALKECESKAGTYPQPCFWPRENTKGKNKGPTFWAVGSGKNYRFEVDSATEANQEWQDPTEWLPIDTESAKLIHDYDPSRDWSRCGYRTFWIDGSDDVIAVACEDGFVITK